MKKIVGFFGIFALIAGFVTSCGDDDDDDEVFVQKRLVKLTKGGESSEFKYDSDGRCVAYSFFKDGEIYVKSSYKYRYLELRLCYTLGDNLRCIGATTFQSLLQLLHRRWHNKD